MKKPHPQHTSTACTVRAELYAAYLQCVGRARAPLADWACHGVQHGQQQRQILMGRRARATHLVAGQYAGQPPVSGLTCTDAYCIAVDTHSVWLAYAVSTRGEGTSANLRCKLMTRMQIQA